MFGIGPMELVVVLVMALLVLGPKRMPELARTLGRGLGEFRRASTELRQSLALDELQDELKNGLTGTGTIHKPGQNADRPAQAGDDLEPGKAGAGAPKDASDTENTASTPSSDGDAARGRTHPGELPLDADPHAHHDEPEGQLDASPPPMTSPQPADSGLGSVPVGDASSTSTAAPGPTPPSGSAASRKTDDERG
jgi:sec-independent protein translocase protein TatB